MSTVSVILEQKIWFSLSLAIIPMLVFIHIEQFFIACSRQQNQEHTCPPTPPLELHLKTFQLSVFWRPGPTSDFRARRRHKKPCCSCTVRCRMCSQAAHGSFSSVSCVWAACAARAPRAFCKHWVCRTFCSNLSEQSFPYTNKCDVALGRERGCWFCWFFFFCLFLVLFFLPHDVGLLYMKPEARLFVTSVVRAVKSKWIFCITVLVLKYRLG